MPERTSMPECKSALQEDLKAYLDGELPSARRVSVERHLTDCADCRSELEGLRLLSTTLVEALPATAPLPDALRTRILASLPDAPTPRPFSLPFWRRPGPMAAFSGVLAMSCAAWLWVRTSGSKSAPQETVGMSAAPAGAYMAPTDLPAKGAITAKAEQEKPAAALAETKSAIALPARENLPQVAAPAPLAQGMTAETFSRAANKPQAPVAKPRQAAAPSATAPESVLLDQTNLAAPADHMKAKADARGRDKEGVHLPDTELSPGLLPSETLSIAKKMESDMKADTGMASRAMLFAAPLPPPQAYTLTVPKGKKPETEEALRKLGEELSVSINRDKPELELALAPPGRAALLERLKTLGKLTETFSETARNASVSSPSALKPSAPSNRGGGFGSFGGGGAFGGASPRASAGGGPMGGGSVGGRGGPVLLKLTLIIKESESEEMP